MENKDRSAFIKLGNNEYGLILTTLATKSIIRRYGGIENLGEMLSNSDDFEKTLDEVIWLITLLANQSIMIHNLWNEDKKNVLTEEIVELLASPFDLAEYKNAILAAMYKGTKRNIKSEDNDEGKNITAE